jgi:hypothetical protein
VAVAVLVPLVDVALGRAGSAQRLEDPRSSPLVCEGVVLEPDGTPAAGAIVVTSAGGKAVTDGDGHYRLQTRVPVDARTIRVSAVGRRGRSVMASTSIGLPGTGFTRVGPLRLDPGSPCQPGWLPTFGQEPGVNNTVRALEVFDDGSGSTLYAGGAFLTAGGITAKHIARWDGSSWSVLDDETQGIQGGAIVNALKVFDDGDGPALIVGGSFSFAGGAPASRIASWDGHTWTTLGSGTNGSVHSLAVFDDGSGPALYAGGVFTVAGGEAASHVARWDGSSWTALGSGTSASVDVITVVVGGAGPVLYAGGSFTTVHESGDSYLALWGCDATPPTLSCPVSVVVTDALADSSGETVSFVVEAEDDHDPSPTVVCVPSSGSSFPPGNSLVTCTATDAAGNQSTCQFQVTVQVKPQLRRR